MKTITTGWKTWFTLLFSWLLFGHHSFAQTVSETMAFANEQFEMGHYRPALKAYQRVLYFSEGDHNWDVYDKMGHSYTEIGEYDLATEYFDLAYFNSTDDSLRSEIAFKKIAVILQQRAFKEALVELYSIEPDRPYFQQKQDFYFGVAFFGTEEYEKSHKHFIATFDSTDHHYLERFDAIFEENDRVSRINPRTAQIMSLIIPGAGQVYAGDFKNGLNSFLLNGSLMTLFGIVAIKTSLVDALVTVYPWFFRYYMGGFKRAGDIALNRKKERRAEVYGDIIQLLLEYRQFKTTGN